jgi:hypothetical protein
LTIPAPFVPFLPVTLAVQAPMVRMTASRVSKGAKPEA